MKDEKVKSKILSEIIDSMGNKDGERLRMHPKLMAMKVTKVEPIDEKMKGMDMEGKMPKVGSPEDIADDKAEKESPDLENAEVNSDIDLDELDKESLDPEILAKLVKLLK